MNTIKIKNIIMEVRYLKILFFIVLPSVILADSWLQTDWRGGEGYFQWTEVNGYYEGKGVHGWRKPGFLTIFAPDIEHFSSIGKMEGAAGVYSLYSDSISRYYAGTGNFSSGSGRIFVTQDFGNSWHYSTVDSNYADKVTSIFLPSFDEEFLVGTERINSSRLYKSINMGDSGWVLVGYLSGTYVSSVLETEDKFLYASTVHSSNNNGKIWYSTNLGTTWQPFEKQPAVGTVKPSAIYQFILTTGIFVDFDFYAAAYFTNYGAKIFRFSNVTQEWEACANLPDTNCIPFAMDIGYDTLENNGVIYVGTGDAYGKVFRSTDKGNSWDTCGILEGSWGVHGIEIDRDGTVCAACRVYGKRKKGFMVQVFRSQNMGFTWEVTSAIGGTLTNKPTSFYQTRKGFLLLGTENEAEIFKASYMDSGYIVSSVYDVGTGNGSSEFGSIYWSENLNGEHLDVKVRTDWDSTMINALPWALCDNCINNQDISDLISVSDGAQYIQYRVELSTDSIDYSPELKEIQIDYTIDSIPPVLDTAYASDGDSILPGIDKDDYVMLIFDDSTNVPPITPDNVNSVLRLSGAHSWWDSLTFVYAEWLHPASLRLSWPGLEGSPTVAVGDTIYPDSFTITDRWCNPCFNPVVITGSFGPAGIIEDETLGYKKEKVKVYPSISNGRFIIRFDTDNDSKVKITLFDITGRALYTFADRWYRKGTYSINWSNVELPSGIYFLKVIIESKSCIKRLTIIR